MRPTPWVLVWVLAGVVAVAALVLFGLGSHPVTGRRAPALPRQRLSGAPTTLAGLLSSDRGRPALVVFWASWCGPCAAEAPALERFSASPQGRGRIVGVDWSDAASGARTFIRHHGWSFPNVRDGEGTVGNAYRITGLPTTFVVDGHGRIRTVLRGPQSEASLHAALARVERS